jgi:hypothetical protein
MFRDAIIYLVRCQAQSPGYLDVERQLEDRFPPKSSRTHASQR